MKNVIFFRSIEEVYSETTYVYNFDTINFDWQKDQWNNRSQGEHGKDIIKIYKTNRYI